MAIRFYHVDEPYGCFSNFSRHSFHLDGVLWPTSEHYFQAQKFTGTPYVEKVWAAESPREAFNLGRDKSLPLRSDWDQVKDNIMRRAVLAKFETHADIRELLLSTGDEEIIEASPVDGYWGEGKDGKGKNRLGKILMEVRSILRDQKNG